MTLTQLRYLVAIADADLNITLAAARVHATQPGLSKQLKQLEDELGFLLFSRRGRSLGAVTEAGAEIIAHARTVLAETNNIRSVAANRRRERRGRLGVATTHTQASFVLPPAIAQVRRAFPLINVHLQPVPEDALLDLLRAGRADLAIISTAGSVPVGGVAVPLYRWRRKVVVPTGHALDRPGPSPGLRTLAEHPLISYESSNNDDSSLRGAFAAEALEPTFSLTAIDADVIKTYVRRGFGVGLLAEMALTAADTDLRVMDAPADIPECITWALLPRESVLRDYTVELVHAMAPQVDGRELRAVMEGNREAAWNTPPTWQELTQTITV
ncbi:LysR family transcriptional regulator [Coralloluteibacterium stylophorae]|uniref:LysR family transcriptional regulator n=1 Tax=Coralloluteibacterium stylophorae TaxID=1776034 RepID=A0A8J7VWD7_9GAMM|nr:LysR family transcriptional regulator [Coralloluteibacterium stylophorae]MBS7456320.1 LysR family transcriptional regulator [Coralloluteibacterium stylophorae]